MNLILQSHEISDYLRQTELIDYHDPLIVKTAKELSLNTSNDVETAKAIYVFVRDKVFHSADINGEYVTCTASDVLKRKEGICYAKSHLLAALMRYSGIPCGFCYQLLRLDDENSPLVIHGLNAIFLGSISKWVRLDSRGNKQGVDAQFSIEIEKLAFEVHDEAGEEDYPYVFADPDLNVIAALQNSKTVNELWSNLPRGLYGIKVHFSHKNPSCK